ncbi:MAG: serine O-acetyltransferase [Clostridiales Family XIII bacterium]|jgi:serine O-acetyltransferase|nr:serine O-acetyltransferase [Clostridiales Family XIII bacterium]
MRYDEREKEIQFVVDAMLASYGEFPDIIRIGRRVHIDTNVVVGVIENLRELMYPGFFDNGNMCEYTKESYVRDMLAQVRHDLSIQIERAYRHTDDSGDGAENAHIKAARTTDEFLKRLSGTRMTLAHDVEASFDGDPAATNIGEIILSYPGIFAITVFRLAHVLWELAVPLIPRLMTEYAHGKTGIDIHPGATVGNCFFLDHGTGIVVGETAVIGNNVKIYQGVTLGAHSTKGGRKLSGNKRHPDIEDNVTIYSGASILGGDTVIGEGSVIGSNAFITASVPKGSRITGETVITRAKPQ